MWAKTLDTRRRAQNTSHYLCQLSADARIAAMLGLTALTAASQRNRTADVSLRRAGRCLGRHRTRRRAPHHARHAGEVTVENVAQLADLHRHTDLLGLVGVSERRRTCPLVCPHR